MEFKLDKGTMPVVKKGDVKQEIPYAPKIDIPESNPIYDLYHEEVRIKHGTLQPYNKHAIRKYVIGVGYNSMKNYYITRFELEDVERMTCELQTFMKMFVGARLDVVSIQNLISEKTFEDLDVLYKLDLIEILNDLYNDVKTMFVRSVENFDRIKELDKIFEKYDNIQIRVDPMIGSVYLKSDRTIVFNGYSKILPWTVTTDGVLSIPIFNKNNTIKYNLVDFIKMCEEEKLKLDETGSMYSEEMKSKYNNIIKLCKGAYSVLYHVLVVDTFYKDC